MVVAYQAEKITGALFLMEKLEKFNTIYPKVLNVINRIREINISFYPIFASAIERTEAKKVPIQQNIDNEIKEKEEIISKCVPFEEEMQQILRQKQLEKENSEESVSEYSMHSIRSIYANEHENYKSLLSEIGGINSKIREKEDAIRDLDGFVRQLSICLKYIDQYTNVVA